MAPPTPTGEEKLVMKYLCKYTNKSYHHLEWLTSKQLLNLDQQMKLKNFNTKWSEHDRHVKQVSSKLVRY